MYTCRMAATSKLGAVEAMLTVRDASNVVDAGVVGKDVNAHET